MPCMSPYSKYELQFFTATILEWKLLLVHRQYKEVIMDSLAFLVKEKRIYLNAYAIMGNHIHVIWHIIHPHLQEDVQRDFFAIYCKNDNKRHAR